MYQTMSGFEDILPSDRPYWDEIERRMQAIAVLFGYRQITTPTLELTPVFSRGVGEGTDIVEKEMYTFEDKGGASVTMRAEGTAPVVRAYIEHGMSTLPQPVKLFYVESIFRYERAQRGRLREHHQVGVEAIGEAGPGIDAEIVALLWTLLGRLGLRDLELKINSIGCVVCRPVYLERLTAYFREHEARLCADCRRRLERNPLRLLDCKQQGCQPIIANAPNNQDSLCEDCRAHFARFQELVAAQDIPARVEPRLVRGLDYYARTVFEVTPIGSTASQSSIAGGGRYDGLIELLGGHATPAIGFGCGVERLILAMKEQGATPPAPPTPLAYVCWMGASSEASAVRLIHALRQNDVPALVNGVPRSLKAQLRAANASGAAYALILGDDEIANATVTVRSMATGVQESVRQDALVARMTDEREKIKEERGKG